MRNDSNIRVLAAFDIFHLIGLVSVLYCRIFVLRLVISFFNVNSTSNVKNMYDVLRNVENVCDIYND